MQRLRSNINLITCIIFLPPIKTIIDTVLPFIESLNNRESENGHHNNLITGTLGQGRHFGETTMHGTLFASFQVRVHVVPLVVNAVQTHFVYTGSFSFIMQSFIVLLHIYIHIPYIRTYIHSHTHIHTYRLHTFHVCADEILIDIMVVFLRPHASLVVVTFAHRPMDPY